MPWPGLHRADAVDTTFVIEFQGPAAGGWKHNEVKIVARNRDEALKKLRREHEVNTVFSIKAV